MSRKLRNWAGGGQGVQAAERAQSQHGGAYLPVPNTLYIYLHTLHLPDALCVYMHLPPYMPLKSAMYAPKHLQYMSLKLRCAGGGRGVQAVERAEGQHGGRAAQRL